MMGSKDSLPSVVEPAQAKTSSIRPSVKGKFIYTGEEKLFIRGVTYGPFRPDQNGNEFLNPDRIDNDFAMMARNHINAVRTYSDPPQWVLDIASKYGLYVMLGLDWEQHVTFLDEKSRIRDIVNRVKASVNEHRGHPAVLCYAIGNEIPSSIIRWYGRRRIERYLMELYEAAKTEDADALVTYVNYPTTEYLNLFFLDFVCYNVFLESQQEFESYLSKLQIIAGDKPLVTSEIGLDSIRNGEEAQAKSIDWQIREAFDAGCAGTFVFSWTDEWHRGGQDIGDWNFGITTATRAPKQALSAVERAYGEVPFPNHLNYPKISVVVCTYNGSRTIKQCLEWLTKLKYSNYEVIVVNDGSTDNTANIIMGYANKYRFKYITTDNQGLSNARNKGLEAAEGEIIAFIDDDAYPDPHWLSFLALGFMRTNHVGIGGPNFAPQNDGFIAECVSNSPGGPSHVLLTDNEAEHIAGCNMAFRKDSLRAIGGFDSQFRVAGDDVDICWQLQERECTLGFSPAAVVWHHPRSSIRGYLKQQYNYGKAETLLEKKWPEKYNTAGHVTWAGMIYSNSLLKNFSLFRERIYHGVWGTSPFQSIYRKPNWVWTSLLHIPEWYLIIAVLALISTLGFLWRPLFYFSPVLSVAILVPFLQAVMAAYNTPIRRYATNWFVRFKTRALIAMLHLLQPIARLGGRLIHGLTPWRRRGLQNLSIPWPRVSSFWSENWQPAESRLESLEKTFKENGVVLRRGGNFDRWDLEVRGGLFGRIRFRMVLEEHGSGRQMIRLGSWPRPSRVGIVLTVAFGLIAILAAMDQAFFVSAILGGIAGVILFRSIGDCAIATYSYLHGIKQHFNHKDFIQV
jgi:glycosyltransferase involved in cell wall biosynthesis